MSKSRLAVIALALAALPLGAARAAEPPAAASQGAPPTETATSEADRIGLFVAGQPDYAALQLDAARRTSPDAPYRLVVIHGGRPVLDFGLRNERQLVPAGEGPGEKMFEEGIIDNAEVAPDGRSAAILSTQYRRPAEDSAQSPDGSEPPRPVGTSVVSWVDARRPEARFSVKVEAGRWVKELLPLAGGAGLALSTTRGLGAPADFELYGPDGREVFRTGEAEGSVTDLTATSNGAFLAVSLAYPERPGLPKMGILVLDLLRGTRWTYTWSYGEQGEPLSWSLEDSGVLEVKVPGKIVRYDRNGAPLRSEGGSGKRKGKAGRA